MHKKNRLVQKGLLSSFIFVYSILYALFYYKYVPLIWSYQLVLIPLLLILVILILRNANWGILFFAFIFPLCNSLPYFFRIYQSVPHAPVALVLFLSFFLGWLLRCLFLDQKIDLSHPLYRPLILFVILVSISAVFTLLRFANFFPFTTPHFRELVLNVNGVRAGGGVMSCVFTYLNYVTGPLLFSIIYSAKMSRRFMIKILFTLVASTGISLLFAIFQNFYSLELGNTPFFISMGRLNSTFKDPNSFGLFLSAFFPILIGIFFYLKKRWRLPLLFLSLMSIIVLTWTGSRSGLLGMILAATVFALMSLKNVSIPTKKKAALWGLVFISIILILSSLLYLSRDTSLGERLSNDLNISMDNFSLTEIFGEGRILFWRVSQAMLKSLPVTGVGIGAFIIDMPNYSKTYGIVMEFTDSAENYFFQIVGELGLAGLILIIWLFLEIFKQLRRINRNTATDSEHRFLVIGLTSSLVAVFVGLSFHSFIGAFDVKYLIWLIIALICNWSREIRSSSLISNHKSRVVLLLLILVLGSVNYWNVSHKLSIANTTITYELNQNFGLYDTEKDTEGFNYNWTGKTVGFMLPNLKQTLVLPMKATHPGIEKYPVRVNVFSADRYFNKVDLIDDFQINHKGWIDYKVSPTQMRDKYIQLLIEIDRSWQPSRFFDVTDSRNLGLSLREPWYEITTQDITSDTEVIARLAAEQWEGQTRDKILPRNTSRIRFITEREATALNLKIWGKKILNISPLVVIRLDNRIIGRTRLTGDDWMSMSFLYRLLPGEHEMSVEFIDDFDPPGLSKTRIVVLGGLEIIALREKNRLRIRTDYQ